jgi:hypothetical protein
MFVCRSNCLSRIILGAHHTQACIPIYGSSAEIYWHGTVDTTRQPPDLHFRGVCVAHAISQLGNLDGATVLGETLGPCVRSSSMGLWWVARHKRGQPSIYAADLAGMGNGIKAWIDGMDAHSTVILGTWALRVVLVLAGWCHERDIWATNYTCGSCFTIGSFFLLAVFCLECLRLLPGWRATLGRALPLAFSKRFVYQKKEGGIWRLGGNRDYCFWVVG